MLKQKQVRDKLTKRELITYGILCYGSITIFLALGYFILTDSAKSDGTFATIISFVFLTIGAVFGFSIQNDVRVIDLRKSINK